MEGWHRALDDQLDLHRWILTDEGYEYTTGVLESMFGQVIEPDDDDIRDAWYYANIFSTTLVQTLWQGDTMFITSDMLHVAMQAAEDLPDDFEYDSRVCLSSHGFIRFEEPIIGTDRREETLVINALAWSNELIKVTSEPEPKMTTIIYMFSDIRDMRDGFPSDLLGKLDEAGIYVPNCSLTHMFPLRNDEGTVIATLPGQEVIAKTVNLFCAIQLLSHQSIGEVVRVQPHRAQRRRYERDYNVASNRMITLITLRRKSMPNGKDPKDIPWTRRWIVRGHWRHQWYPSLKRHEYKYIPEYIKGPEDKPLITGRRVFNFRR